MTGLPVSLLGLSLLFSFQSLQAPGLSAEPDRRSRPPGRTKAHSIEQAPDILPVCRKAILGVPPRLSSRFRSLAGKLYTTSTRNSNLESKFLLHPRFFANPSPSPLGGALPLGFAESCGSVGAGTRGGRRSRGVGRSIVAPVPGTSSDGGKILHSSAGRRDARSDVCRPEELCPLARRSGERASRRR